MNSIEDRIRQIMESENLSQQDFAKLLEISPASLSSIFNGRTRATHNHTNAIHKAFPNLNINWLLFGEGEMYEKGGAVDNSAANGNDSQYQDGFKVYNNNPAISSVNGSFVETARPGYPQNYFENRDSREPSKDVKKFDVKPRQVKEIRVFFDDGTYESFVPQK